jgi:hypothetical protein
MEHVRQNLPISQMQLVLTATLADPNDFHSKIEQQMLARPTKKDIYIYIYQYIIAI